MDEDSRLVDELWYEIDAASMTASDSTLAGIDEPFILENLDINSVRTGVLKTNFEPQDRMKGYFEFTVKVTDSRK